MRDAVVTAALEHIERADDVALDIGVRLFQRVAHPRLSAQMHDALEFLGGEQASPSHPGRPSPRGRTGTRGAPSSRARRACLSDTS